jgi:hypothetical protein
MLSRQFEQRRQFAGRRREAGIQADCCPLSDSLGRQRGWA